MATERTFTLLAGNLSPGIRYSDFTDLEVGTFRLLLLEVPSSENISIFYGSNLGTAEEITSVPKAGREFDLTTKFIALRTRDTQREDFDIKFAVVPIVEFDEPAPQVVMETLHIDIVPFWREILFINPAQNNVAYLTDEYLWVGNDGDSQEYLESFSYEITGGSAGGTLQKLKAEGVRDNESDWVAMNSGETFTQYDVSQKNLRYVFDSDATDNKQSLFLTMSDNENNYLADFTFEIAKRDVVREQLAPQEETGEETGDKTNTLDFTKSELGLDIRATNEIDTLLGTSFDDKLDGGLLDDVIYLDSDNDLQTSGGADEVIFYIDTREGGSGIRLTSGGDTILNFKREEDSISFITNGDAAASLEAITNAFEVSPIYDYANGQVLGLYFIFRETVLVEGVGLSGNIINIYFDSPMATMDFIHLLGSDLSFYSNTIVGDDAAATFAAISRAVGGVNSVQLKTASYIEFDATPAQITISIEDAITANNGAIGEYRTGWKFSVHDPDNLSDADNFYSFIIENADDGTVNNNFDVTPLDVLNAGDPQYELLVKDSFAASAARLNIYAQNADGVLGRANLVEFSQVVLGEELDISAQRQQIVFGETVVAAGDYVRTGQQFKVEGSSAVDYEFQLVFAESKFASEFMLERASLTNQPSIYDLRVKRDIGERYREDINISVAAYNADGVRVSRIIDFAVEIHRPPTIAEISPQSLTATFGELYEGTPQRIDGEDFYDLGTRFKLSDDNEGVYSFRVLGESGEQNTDYFIFATDAQEGEYGMFVKATALAFLHRTPLTVEVFDDIENLTAQTITSISVDNMRLTAEQDVDLVVGEQPPTRAPNVIAFNLNDIDGPADVWLVPKHAQAIGVLEFTFSGGGSIGVSTLDGKRVSVFVGVRDRSTFTYEELRAKLEAESVFTDNYEWVYVNPANPPTSFTVEAGRPYTRFDFSRPDVAIGQEITVGLDKAAYPNYDLVLENAQGKVSTDFFIRRKQGDVWEVFAKGDTVLTEDLTLTSYVVSGGVKVSSGFDIFVNYKTRPEMTIIADTERVFEFASEVDVNNIAAEDVRVVDEDGTAVQYVYLGHKFALTDDNSGLYEFSVTVSNGALIDDVASANYKILPLEGNAYGLYIKAGAQTVPHDQTISISVYDSEEEIGNEIFVELNVNDLRGTAEQSLKIAGGEKLDNGPPVRGQINLDDPDGAPVVYIVPKAGLGASVTGRKLTFIASDVISTVETYQETGGHLLVVIGTRGKSRTVEYEYLRKELEKKTEFTSLFEWQYADEDNPPVSFDFTPGEAENVATTIATQMVSTGYQFTAGLDKDDYSAYRVIINEADGTRSENYFALHKGNDVWELYTYPTRTTATEDVVLTAYAVASGKKSDPLEIVIDVVSRPTLEITSPQTAIPTFSEAFAGVVEQHGGVNYIDLGTEFAVRDSTDGGFNVLLVEVEGYELSDFLLLPAAGKDTYRLLIKEGTIGTDFDAKLTISINDTTENIIGLEDIIIDVNNLRATAEQDLQLVKGEASDAGPPVRAAIDFDGDGTADVWFVAKNPAEAGVWFSINFDHPSSALAGGYENSQGGFIYFVRGGTDINYEDLRAEFEANSDFNSRFDWQYVDATNPPKTFNEPSRALRETTSEIVFGTGIQIEVGVRDSEYSFVIENPDGSANTDFEMRRTADRGGEFYELVQTNAAAVYSQDFSLNAYAVNAEDERISETIAFEIDVIGRLSVGLVSPQTNIPYFGEEFEGAAVTIGGKDYVSLGYKVALQDDNVGDYSISLLEHGTYSAQDFIFAAGDEPNMFELYAAVGTLAANRDVQFKARATDSIEGLSRDFEFKLDVLNLRKSGEQAIDLVRDEDYSGINSGLRFGYEVEVGLGDDFPLDKLRVTSLSGVTIDAFSFRQKSGTENTYHLLLNPNPSGIDLSSDFDVFIVGEDANGVASEKIKISVDTIFVPRIFTNPNTDIVLHNAPVAADLFTGTSLRVAYEPGREVQYKIYNAGTQVENTDYKLVKSGGEFLVDTYQILAKHGTDGFYEDARITVEVFYTDVTIADTQKDFSINFQELEVVSAAQTLEINAAEVRPSNIIATDWIDLGTEADNARFRFVAKDGTDPADVLGVTLDFTYSPGLPLAALMQSINTNSEGKNNFPVLIGSGATDLAALKAGIESPVFLAGQSFNNLFQWEWEDGSQPEDVSFTPQSASARATAASVWDDVGHIIYAHAADQAGLSFTYEIDDVATSNFRLEAVEGARGQYNLQALASAIFADDFDLEINLLDASDTLIDDIIVSIDVI